MAFHCRDAADPELSGRYDLVTIFEALHDMSYPVDVLRTARGLLADGGRVLVADEKTAEHFALDAGDVERLYYGFSVLHCLPVGMVGENAAGTGTVMREDTVRGYAEQAGFAGLRGRADRERLLALLPTDAVSSSFNRWQRSEVGPAGPPGTTPCASSWSASPPLLVGGGSPLARRERQRGCGIRDARQPFHLGE